MRAQFSHVIGPSKLKLEQSNIEEISIMISKTLCEMDPCGSAVTGTVSWIILFEGHWSHSPINTFNKPHTINIFVCVHYESYVEWVWFWYGYLYIMIMYMHVYICISYKWCIGWGVVLILLFTCNNYVYTCLYVYIIDDVSSGNDFCTVKVLRTLAPENTYGFPSHVFVIVADEIGHISFGDTTTLMIWAHRNTYRWLSAKLQ